METVILFIATGVVGVIVFLWWNHQNKKEKMTEKHQHHH